jgi:hypothetical protein
LAHPFPVITTILVLFSKCPISAFYAAPSFGHQCNSFGFIQTGWCLGKHWLYIIWSVEGKNAGKILSLFI